MSIKMSYVYKFEEIHIDYHIYHDMTDNKCYYETDQGILEFPKEWAEILKKELERTDRKLKGDLNE
jgi:hypothetical protein